MSSVLQEKIILCSYFGISEVWENIKFYFKRYPLVFGSAQSLYFTLCKSLFVKRNLSLGKDRG